MKNKTGIRKSAYGFLPFYVAEQESLADFIVDIQDSREQFWPAQHFGEVKVVTNGMQHVFEVFVYYNELDPKTVYVDLYAEGINGSKAVLQEMKKGDRLAGIPGAYRYSGTVSTLRPVTDYSVRLMQDISGISVPLETTKILWLR